MDELILEKAAIQFRSECGINNKDAIRLKSLLQKLNVIIIFKSLVDDFSRMALKIGEGAEVSRFILINTQQSLGKQHFTICHELYHLFIQKAFTSRVCKTSQFNKKLDREEYNADLFASHLLLPKDGLLELIPDHELQGRSHISIQTTVYLEQYFSCSRRALLYRLKKMKLLTDAQYEQY
jgi:Zn-dependent peptidase ImmA (M78 family)